MHYLISRLLCSFLTGVIISQTGSLVQLGTRNILASPSTLGFDGVAILWLLVFHSITLWLGFESQSYQLIMFGLPVFLGLGFLFSSFLKGKSKFERIILLGLTFNLLVGAIFSLWQFFFMAFNLSFPVELWFGHFRFTNLQNVFILILTEAAIILGFFVFRKDLMLYSLGEGVSKIFRLDGKSLFAFFFIAVSVGTFVAVGLFGAFSFLGLVFPIVARRIWFKNADLRGEIVYGGILNGCFLMLIDLVCYFFPIFGAEVPVGLIVTAVGAVSLIFLLWKDDSREILAKSSK